MFFSYTSHGAFAGTLAQSRSSSRYGERAQASACASEKGIYDALPVRTSGSPLSANSHRCKPVPPLLHPSVLETR